MSYLIEAFQELDLLDDKENKKKNKFNLGDKDDAKKAKERMEDIDDVSDIEMVVDIDAEDEEDLRDTYVGSLLLYCPTCHTIHYKDEDEVEQSEDEPTLFNVGEPCPHCQQKDGFEVKGKVAPYGGETDTEEDDLDDLTDWLDDDESDDDSEDEPDEDDKKVDEGLSKKAKARKILKESFKMKNAKEDIPTNLKEEYGLDGTVGKAVRKSFNVTPKEESCDGSKKEDNLKERNLTRAERHNRNMDEGCGKSVKEDLSYGELADFQNAWEEYKKKVGYVYDGNAQTALEFIDDYVKAHPEYDNDETRDVLFGEVSVIEEPLKENKSLRETGEWEDDEQGINWKKYLANLIRKYTGNKVSYKDMDGFDKYQGPEYNDGNFEYFTDGENQDYLLVHDINTTVNAPCWYRVGSKEDFKALMSGNLEPLKENLKESQQLKEGFYDVLNSLIDRAKSWVDDGYEPSDAVNGAIDDGLIYTSDIVDLGVHYGVIDDQQVVADMYDDLFQDMIQDVEDYYNEKEPSYEDKLEDLGLPTEETVTYEELNYDPETDDLNDVVTDYLSDSYGYLVNGLDIEDKDGTVTITNIEWDLDESLKKNGKQINESKKQVKALTESKKKLIKERFIRRVTKAISESKDKLNESIKVSANTIITTSSQPEYEEVLGVLESSRFVDDFEGWEYDGFEVYGADPTVIRDLLVKNGVGVNKNESIKIAKARPIDEKLIEISKRIKESLSLEDKSKLVEELKSYGFENPNFTKQLKEAKGDIQKSPYKDIIGKYFDYSVNFDFLDIVAEILNRIDFEDLKTRDYENAIYDVVTEEVDSALTYIADQWEVLEEYVSSPADLTNETWDEVLFDFGNDIGHICELILKGDNGEQDNTNESLTEAPIYGLEPQYDSRKSFYGKAQVNTGDNNDKNQLFSYDTLVGEIKDGKPVIYGTYSQTTLRHIKDWLKQNGFKADNAKQILADYGVKKESCKTEGCDDKTPKKKSKFLEAHYNQETGEVEADLFYGVPEVEFIWHGEWADPEVAYKGKLYSYIDLEDTLYDDFKDRVQSGDITISTDGYEDLPRGTKEQQAEEDAFFNFVKGNPDLVYEILSELEPTDTYDDVDESLFENLVNKYCISVYENVKDFKLSNCKSEKGNLILEGLLTYKNGKTKETKFLFEKSSQKENKLQYKGINETFAKNKKAFTLNCTVENKKLLSESLNFDYKVKVDGNSRNIRGKVSNRRK